LRADGRVEARDHPESEHSGDHMEDLVAVAVVVALAAVAFAWLVFVERA
jgi:hypothetical protein